MKKRHFFSGGGLLFKKNILKIMKGEKSLTFFKEAL